MSNISEAEDESRNDSKANIIEHFKNTWAVKEWKKGFFTEDYIYDINIHWLMFSPPNTSSFIIMAILYIVIMIVGVFGNFLVIFMYIRCKTLRTAANTLIVNLAISDSLLLLKTPVFIYNCFYKGPILGDIACRIYAFIGGLTGVVSIVTLAAISFDRYFVIKYPLSRKYSKVRTKSCLFCSWIYGLVFSIIPLLDIGFGKYQYEGYLTSCSFDYLSENQATRWFIIVFFCAAWVVPFSLITFSYIKIIQVVGRRPWGKKRESFRHVKEEDQRKQEIKLAIIVLMVICLWFFSWTPYATVALLGISGQKHLITPLSSMIPALFCKMASAIDPYVYAISHPKFREELWKMTGISTKKAKKNHKVWSTDDKSEKPSARYDSEDVEEETVELELRSIPQVGNFPKIDERDEGLEHHGRQFKRQTSYATVLCCKPSFSNRPSSFRKFSRRFSSLRAKQNDGK